MTVRPRQPGDRLTIAATEWNAIARAVNSTNTFGGRVGEPAAAQTYTGVIAKNTTSADIDVWGAVAITGLAVVPDIERPGAAFTTPAMAVKGTAGSAITYGVALEPINAGRIGRVAVDAVAMGRVNRLDTAHRYARPNSTAGVPISDTAGPFQLLTTASSTGEGWALLRFGVDHANTWTGRITAASAITVSGLAASTTTRWAYTVREERYNGTEFVSRYTTAHEVTAYNRAELSNDGAGMQGNGVNITSDVPSGTGAYLNLREAADDRIVTVESRFDPEANTVLNTFDADNGIDLSCGI
jgi:hypothetical protein